MNISNKIMLITYADSMGNNLSDLLKILDKYFSKAIAGIHILPFFPSSADRGFAPLTYKEVSQNFGTWQDIHKLGQQYYLMFDFMINHISQKSEYFQDFLQNKENSPYKDLFIRFNTFFQNEDDEKRLMNIVYKRKDKDPYIEAHFSDGSTEKIWSTFDEQQIDLHINTDTTKKFIQENLEFLASQKASIIRLDAFAYAVKKKETNCFFVKPDVWEVIDSCKKILENKDVKILPEIHEHYSIQLELAQRGYYVYDFALPMLVLYSLYSGKNHRLLHWLEICPKNQFTTLDTHDGIGIVDVKDLLSDEEVSFTQEQLFTKGANIKKIYNTSAYNNLDIYQINCSYYSALGDNDNAYLLARAIQFFTLGIPQVYYMGLLAGKNDIELLEKTKVGRNINRHYYSLKEIDTQVKRPVVQNLLKLMEFRNICIAFDGKFIIDKNTDSQNIKLIWKNNCANTQNTITALLEANLQTKKFTVSYTQNNTHKIILEV